MNLHSSTPDFSQFRFLLADDNSIDQKLLCSYLAETGATLDCVSNGLEAVEKANTQAYDLILMDMHMPVMDGLSAVSKIRQSHNILELPIMTISSGNDQVNGDQPLVNRRLNKPIDIDCLFDALTMQLLKSSIPNEKQSVHKIQVDYPLLQIKLDQLSILEYQDAVTRFQGKIALYLDLLNDFSYKYSDSASKFKNLYEGQMWHELTLNSHSLKTSAFYIGAVELSKQAAQIELYAKTPTQLSPEQFTRLSELMSAVTVDMQDLLEYYREHMEVSASNDIDLFDLITSIKPLLKGFDSDAEAAIKIMMSNKKAKPVIDELHNIYGLIKDIEFKKALEQIEALEQELKKRN